MQVLAPFGALSIALASATLGCGSDKSGSQEEQAQATVKAQITTQLGNLVNASMALRAAAPAPDADGWNDIADAAAVNAMKTQWAAARRAYEQIEGAIAVFFPDYDVSTDERYDDFLADKGPDNDLFDGMGVTGIHAIERILWAGHAPADVVAFESMLDGYVAAGFPSNLTQANEFRDGLATRLVTDVQAVQAMFAPLTLDTAAAFRGVIGSLGEQVEKIELAADGEDESRYAQHTLADMRANLTGGKNTYDAFRDWVRSEPGGQPLDADILAGFDRVSALYAGVTGDALPPVPAGFNADAPTADQLATPYGMILAGLSTESNADDPSSLVSKMSAGAIAAMRAGLIAPLLLLAFGLLSSSGCLDDEMDPALQGGRGSTFIALARDFQSFLSWSRTQVGDAAIAGGHAAGPRFAYVSTPPVDGKFPFGAMIAKTVEVGDPTTWSIHAKAKRGGGFNPSGAINWEWFELRIVANNDVTILWRGAAPPKDHGYESLPGLGATSAMEGDCNTCHVLSPGTDYLISPVLQMQFGF